MHSISCISKIAVLYLSILMIGRVVSRPDGAPTAACDDMVPQHIGEPETSDSPFATKVAKEEMWSNETLKVTLQQVKDNSNDKFKGFLLVAFNSAGSDTTSIIGTFDLKDMGRTMDCRDDGSKNAATHKDKTSKNIVVATWIPPQDFDGSVIFRTTFVKSYSSYWMKVASPVVRVKRASVVSNSVPTEETSTKKPNKTTPVPSSHNKSEDEESARTTTAPTEIPDSASTISLLAFYSVVIIGITIAFMA